MDAKNRQVLNPDDTIANCEFFDWDQVNQEQLVSVGANGGAYVAPAGTT